MKGQLELLLPEELYQVMWHGVEAKISQLRYSQVIMPLSALLEGDFFNFYIKTGIYNSVANRGSLS